MTCHGRTDDGSDDTIVSPRVAEAGVLKGMGKFVKIKPVPLQVALCDNNEATKFTFSRTCIVPMVVMHLSAGQLALLNVIFLVADANIAFEDLLIGQPLLAILGVDSRTLLENNRAQLDGTDCASIPNISPGTKSVGRLMIARLQNKKGTEPQPATKDNTRPLDPNRTRTNYYLNHDDTDWFPIPSLIDIADRDQHAYIKAHVEQMLQRAENEGFPSGRMPELREVV